MPGLLACVLLAGAGCGSTPPAGAGPARDEAQAPAKEAPPPPGPTVADELRRLAAENQTLGPVHAAYEIYGDPEGDPRGGQLVLHATPEGCRINVEIGQDRMEWRFTLTRQVLLLTMAGGPPRVAVLDLAGLVDVLAAALGVEGAPTLGDLGRRLRLHVDFKPNTDPSRKTRGELSFRGSLDLGPGSALGWLDTLQASSFPARVREATLEFDLDPARHIRLELSRAHGFPTRVWAKERVGIQLVKFRQGEAAGQPKLDVASNEPVDADLSAQLARGMCHVWFRMVRELARREREAGDPAGAEARTRRVLDAAADWTVRQCAPPESSPHWARLAEQAEQVQRLLDAAPVEQAPAVRAEAARQIESLRAHFAGVIEAELSQFRALLVDPDAPDANAAGAATRALEDAAVEAAFRRHYAEPLRQRFEETLGALEK